jgi:hypothetical protein
MSHQDRLVEFHRTISGQLNARLEESPRFFWVLVAVTSGYGYVLWNCNTIQSISQRRLLVLLVSCLSYSTVLWASWYLAALGYAFRFLQNSQHCIERALGWSPDYVPIGDAGENTGEPPQNIASCADIFWLLPGIYHAHAGGLCAFLTLLCVAFGWQLWDRWKHCGAIIFSFGLWAGGLLFIAAINWHYLRKFRRKRRNPSAILKLEG